MSAQTSQAKSESSHINTDESKVSIDNPTPRCELIASGPKYDGTGIRTSLHGTIYQINLLMLFMNRGLRRGYTFSLATEVDAADKFDDLVFKYEVNKVTKYRFLQAKHKQDHSLKITESELTNETEGDFSLQKYFNSFLKIKYAKRQFFQGEYEDFILCTNIDIDSSIQKYFYFPTDEDHLLGFHENQCTKQPKRLKLLKNSNLHDKLKPILRKVQSSDKNPEHLKIARKLGKNVATCNVITNDKKNVEYRDWMMQFIFDKDSKITRGSEQRPKYYFKLRKDLLDPPADNEDMIELNFIFFQAYNEAIAHNTEIVEKQIHKPQLMETYYEVAAKFVNAKSKVNKPSTDDDIDIFLEMLVLAVNQPTEDELKYIVEEEIGEYMSLIDGEFIASRLQRGILDWAKTRHGRVLQVEDCREFFSNIETQLARWGQFAPTITLKTQITKHNCLFDLENKQIKRLSECIGKKGKAQVILMYYINLLVSQIKLMQVIKSGQICTNKERETDFKDDAFIFSEINTLLDQMYTLVCPIKAFRSRACNLMFVILHEQTQLQGSHVTLVKKLLEVITKNSDKKIIFIVPLNISVTFNDHFKSLFRTQTFVEIYDTNDTFCDLSSSTQQMLLAESKVKFQGFSVNLGKILDDSDILYGLHGDVLMKIILREFELQLDDEDKAYKEIKEFCVDRYVYRCIKISSDIFKDNYFVVAFHCDGIDVINDQEIVLITYGDNKNVYEKLSSGYKETVHWLKQEKDELFWLASSGPITNLRKYVLDKQKTITPPELNTVDIFDSGLEHEYIFPLSEKFEESNNTNMQKESQYIKLNQVQDIDDKIAIICAEPGMGKSTITTHLVSKNKTSNSESEGTCIIKANLRDYSQYFKDHPKDFGFTLHDAEDFIYEVSKLSQVTKKIKQDNETTYLMYDNANINKKVSSVESLGYKFFSYLYNAKKIVLLLDGFDEIAPDYIEPVLSLLEALKHTKLLKIWVTTRPYNIQYRLENHLNTFSYSLIPFTLSEQLQFISNFWQNKLRIKIEHEYLINFLRKHMLLPILQIEQNEIYGQTLFMGIPLHVLMIATIYEKLFSAYHKSGFADFKGIEHYELTLYDLYNKFIENKFKILYREIADNFADTRYGEYKLKFEENKKKHQKLALMDLYSINEIPDEFIFGEETGKTKSYSQKQETLNTLLESVTTGAEKTGLVTRESIGRPCFVHRTFAEYFIADLLTEALQMRESPKYKIAKEFLYKITTAGQQNCILLFINYKIVSGTEDAAIFNAALGLNLPDISPYLDLRDKFGRSPAHFMFSTGKIICNNRHNYPIANLDFLYVKDELFNWTPLHYGIVSHDCSLIKICFNKHFLINNENELKDNFGSSPYILAARRGCSYKCISAFLLELPLSVNVQDSAGMTALHYALARTDPIAEFLASQIITIGADLTIPNNKSETPFQIILSQKREPTLCALVKKIYKDIKNRPVFSDIFEDKVTANKDFCVFLLSRNLALTQILLQNLNLDINTCDSEGKTALHYSFQRLHLDGTDTLLHLLKKNADVNIRDNYGKIPAHFDNDAMMEIFDRGHSPKLFTALDEMTGKDSKIMKPLILSLDLNGDIIVQILCRYRYIADVLLSQGTDVNATDSYRKTALHYAVMWRRPHNVGFLLSKNANAVALDAENKTPLQYLNKGTSSSQNLNINTTPEKIHMILLYLLKYGAYYDDDPGLYKVGNLIGSIQKLFISVISGNLEDVKSILSNSSETQVVVNAKSKNKDWTPIYYAVFGNHTEIVKELLYHGASYIVTDDENVKQEIKMLLLSVQNVFLAINSNDKLKVLNYIEQSKSVGTTLAVVNASYTLGNMIFQPLHLALDENNADILEILLQNGAKTNFKASGERTVLHLACQRSNRSLQVLLEYLSLDDLYEMFLHEDINRRTPLIVAVLQGDCKNLNVFLEKCIFYQHKEKYNGKIVLSEIRTAMEVANKVGNTGVVKMMEDFFRICNSAWDPLKNLREQMDRVIISQN